MHIDDNAPVKTSRETEVRASVTAVWDALANIDHWPDWHPGITTTVLHGRLEPGTTFHWVANGFRLNSTLREVNTHKTLGWEGSGLGATAIHLWEIKSLDRNRTRVCSRESMDGWLVRLFRKTMQRKLDESLQSWLSALKQRAEARGALGSGPDTRP